MVGSNFSETRRLELWAGHNDVGKKTGVHWNMLFIFINTAFTWDKKSEIMIYLEREDYLYVGKG